MHWFWRMMMAAAIACVYAAATAPLATYVRECLSYTIGLLVFGLAPYHGVLFLIGWAVPAVIVGVAAYGFLTHRVRSLGNETRCRRCGYILRGITEPRCPECGERI